MKKKFWGISKRKFNLVQTLTSIKFIASLAVLLLVATFGAWTYHNTTNADRVFWGMVDDNLRTSSYTRHTEQKNGSQSVNQTLQTYTSPRQVVLAETVFVQTGVDSATAVTQNMGTVYNDYVRYNSIQTSQKTANGQPLDFSEVLNVWGVTESEDKSKTTGQLYNQAVLGVIPTGSLSKSERRTLIQSMKDQKAYSYTVAETTRSLPFGRPTYTFSVTVKPVAYITGLKNFAAAVGLNHLVEINPNDYASAQELAFEVSVDGWTHQMTVSSQPQAGKKEIISGRNLKKPAPNVPNNAISVEDLQTRLQSVR